MYWLYVTSRQIVPFSDRVPTESQLTWLCGRGRVQGRAAEVEAPFPLAVRQRMHPGHPSEALRGSAQTYMHRFTAFSQHPPEIYPT